MSDVITLTKVRLSYPHVFERSMFNNEEGKFSAVLLIPKDSKDAKHLMREIKRANESLKAPKDKLCIRDGDDVDSEGYEGHWALKASNRDRPVVVDRDRTPLVKDDNVIYPGCYVNAKVGLWAQDNRYGKRINCNLHGIQFHSDGESFGSDRITADDFDDLQDIY